MLDPLSETGSSEASGDVLGDVDIGDPADLSAGADGCAAVGSSRSRNGFLLLLGEVKGLERPMVANFWSSTVAAFASSSLAVGAPRKGLVKGLVEAWLSVNRVSF